MSRYLKSKRNGASGFARKIVFAAVVLFVALPASTNTAVAANNGVTTCPLLNIYRCERRVMLPFYASDLNWTTEIDIRSDAGAQVTAFISIAVGILAEWNGDFDDNAQKPITQNQTFMVSLTRAQMPTGLLQFDTVQFVRDVDSAGTLEKVVADTVLQFRDSSGKMRSQTSIPFPRGVSSRWSALIAESPRSERGKPGSVRTTFAIDNADASLEQTIIVTVYDDQGRQVGKGKFIPKSPTYYLNPGVYSATLADILGFDLPASQGSRDFHGTVVFEGEQKVPFQPTVFQVSDGAFYSTPATAE